MPLAVGSGVRDHIPTISIFLGAPFAPRCQAEILPCDAGSTHRFIIRIDQRNHRVFIVVEVLLHGLTKFLFPFDWEGREDAKEHDIFMCRNTKCVVVMGI